MFKLIAVTERKLCLSSLAEQVELIAQTAVKPQMLILREKDLPAEEYLNLADAINAVCQKYHIEFFIHSFWQEAKGLYVNIHLPYQVFMSEAFQQQKSFFRQIGVSVHSRAEAMAAEKMGADYVIFGNVYVTSCKHGLTGRGTAVLNDVCRSVNIPVYAIGGIDFTNQQEIAASLAAGACLRSAYMQYK